MFQSPLEWFSLLETYTTCSLTNEGDKLTAISGIAKICARNFDSPYLAGIWADRLAIGLMWMNVGSPLQRPRSTRASSWAWSAYDGPIQFPLMRQTVSHTSSCKLLHVEASNPAWLNGPGDLTIEVYLLDLSPILSSGGLFLSLSREELRPASARTLRDEAQYELFRHPSIRLFNTYNARRFLWLNDPRNIQADGSWIVLDSEDRPLTQKDCGMPLSFASLAYFGSNGEAGRGSVHMGIFLAPGTLDGTFRRVGAGLISHEMLARLKAYRATCAHHGTSPAPYSAQPYEFERRRITLT